MNGARFLSFLMVLLFLLMGLWACPDEAKVISADPPGDRARYEPFASLSAVQSFAGPGAELLSVTARFVRADGTMDLSAEHGPTVLYIFLRPRPGDPDLPVGAGGGSGYEKVQVRVSAPGYMSRKSTGSINVKINSSHKGMVILGTSGAKKKTRKKVVPPPQCTPEALWRSAVESGAPKDAVAVIGYGKNGYSFRIEGTDIEENFDFFCKPGRERSAKSVDRDDRRAARKAEKAIRKEEKRLRREEKKRAREKRLGR
ncbi:MAG: hypothetical protein JRF33_17940 [Deltaproteobacteria bacterium]|nr:hypothetical protein [Deltaproteobacteria bacterium]